MTADYAVYPNIRGHLPDQHGYVRVGTVEDNDDTRKMEIGEFCAAGQAAAVTQEADGMAVFYIYTVTNDTFYFPGVPLWVGPFFSISEDIKSEGDNDD